MYIDSPIILWLINNHESEYLDNHDIASWQLSRNNKFMNDTANHHGVTSLSNFQCFTYVF